MKMFRFYLFAFFLLFSSFLSFSQQMDVADDPVQYRWIFNDPVPWPSDGQKHDELDITIGTFELVEDSTFSFRKINGVKTGTFFDMTSWDSGPFKQGYLRRSWNDTYNHKFSLNYRLHFPLNYDQNYTQGYPLILFMHGAGERGNCWDSQNPPCYWADKWWTPGSNPYPPSTATLPPGSTNNTPKLLNNDLVLSNGGQAHDAAVNRAAGKHPDDPSLLANAWPGFVLFPQNMNSWSSADPQHVIRVVRLLIKKYKIDPNRIFVHGLSDGGLGTYEILKRAPWLFTAGLPMSAISDAELIEKSTTTPYNYLDYVTHIPLWQFQGGKDTGPLPATTTNYRNTFINNGMSVRYTLYPSLAHSVWNNAYSEPDFFLWMRNKNKSDIAVRYGNTSICSSSGAGVEMRLAYGFWAYQWQKDGQTISGATSAIYTANQPGTYRARFSRVKNPTEAQWNRWSNPVVVAESNDPAPIITAVGSTHMPGINGETTVMLKGPANNKYYYWYKDGVKISFAPLKDTMAFITVNRFGGEAAYTLQVAGITNCKTPLSLPMYIRSDDPQTIAAPDNIGGTLVSPSSINLFWRDRSNNETAFEVYRALSTSTKYKLVSVTGGDVVSYLDNGLKPDSTYKYVLRAISNSAESPFTSPFTIGTGSDNIPPSIPQNLTLVTDSITGQTTAAVRVKWDAATDNSGIKEYVVSWTGGSTGSQTVTGDKTTCLITGLVRNAKYNFTVVAHDISIPFNSSAASNQLYVETIMQGLNYVMSEGNWTTLYGYPGNATTAVNWTKVEDLGHVDTVSIAPRKQDDFFYLRFYGYLNIKAAGSYQISLNSKEGAALYVGSNGNPVTTLYPNNPSTNFSDYSPGGSIRWIDNDGIKSGGLATSVVITKTLGVGVVPISLIFFENQGPGETLEFTWKTPGASSFVTVPASVFTSIATPLSPSVPDVPASLAAHATGQSTIALTWTAATTTEVYRSTTLSGTYAVVGQSGSQTFTDTNLNPGVTYYYKVRAVSSGGASGFTSVVNATTTIDTSAPTVPTNLSVVTSTFTNAVLTWTNSSDDVAVTLYNIFANGSLIGTSPNNVFTATALTPNTAYSFSVSAKDASGNESAKSAVYNLTTNQADIYYYNGSGPLSNLTSWGKQTDGTGVQPSSFATNGQYFIIANTQTASVNSSWSVDGNVSKVIVSGGTTLTINNTLTGTITAMDNSTINVNNLTMPVFDNLSPSSTVNFNTYTTIPVASYGNLNLLGTGVKDVQAGNSTIAGNLTIANGITLKGSPSNGSSLTVSGNVSITGTLTEFATDNNITLKMAGAGTNSISTGGDLALYLLDLGPGKTVTLNNNASSTPLNLKLGSANGGGLTLEDGSVFRAGNNNLTFQFSAMVNQGSSTTGQLDMTGGNIDLTTSAIGNSTFNFGPIGKTVGLFTTNLTASGASVTIGQPVTFTDGLKIKQGIFNANGNVTLESTATTTASIREIENGGVINGAVTVKRYAAPQGQVYRYVSFPVANVKVADLQTYVPVNGRFAGANATSTPTLYRYTTDWVAFPTSSNQELFEKGRGYSFLDVNGNTPLWQSTGVPYQGPITISNLIGGTGASGNGWNLVGNPYASPIVWKTGGGWQTSGIATTIYVRYNHGASFDWKVWNTAANGGNGDGSLAGGKIPSGQAFWIQATTSTPSMIINESAKSTDNGSQNASFFRENVAPPFGSFKLSLNGKGSSDPTFLYINSTAKDAFDKMSDSEKMSNSYFNLSTFSSDSIKLAINQLSGSFSSCQKVVGVSVENTTPGQYTLTSDVASWEGDVVLKDHYLNTEVSFLQGESYSFEVTNNNRTFGRKRFTLEFASPDINVNAPLLTSSSSLCAGSGSATISLKNTQNGVSYTLIDNAGNNISRTAVANGEPLDFSVSEANLASGVNTFRVAAEWSGCRSVILPTSTAMTYSQLPTVGITASAINLCEGGTEVITATGAPTDGSYRWYQQDQNGSVELRYTGDELKIESMRGGAANFVVTAINSNGCESQSKDITIHVITLDVPEISQSGDTFYSSSNYNNQWLKDGQPIGGMTGISFKPVTPGVYSVRTSANGCSKDSDPINYLVNGLEQPSAADGYLVVYPNPTSQHNLQLRGNLPGSLDETVDVQLIDTNGKIHLSTQFTIEAVNNGVKLDTSSDTFAPGLYLVVMKVGSITTKRKVMIN